MTLIGWLVVLSAAGVLIPSDLSDKSDPPIPLPPSYKVDAVQPLELPPGSLWSEQSGSLFEDFKARRVGDLLTIVVTESTTASANADTAVKKSESASTQAGVGPLLKLLWPELSAGGKSDLSASGSTTRSGRITARITVVVVETMPNGVLRVEGRRTLKINDETQTLIFSGLVRIRDIRADNTIPSALVANAQIQFEGKGAVGSRQREGLITRFFKVLF
jgi:flagellar L-ring protein precursor FlgH